MDIAAKKKIWQEANVAKNIAKAPERQKEFLTTSNIEMERCFTPGFDYPGYEEQLGFPGEFPFTEKGALAHRTFYVETR